MIGRIRRLLRDERGTYIVEFAVVLPVFLTAVMGGMDLCYRGYTQSLLTGAVQKVGRDSSLQGGAGNIAANDAKVAAAVRTIAKDATFVYTRTSFTRFRDVEGEPFTDDNADGDRDPGECYDDVNGNSNWDASVASVGQGGADDVVLYKVEATYPRLFPLAGLLGWPDYQKISAETMLKNQPYASQNLPTVGVKCT